MLNFLVPMLCIYIKIKTFYINIGKQTQSLSYTNTPSASLKDFEVRIN